MTESLFVETVRSAGARVFRVGGCVRDAFRGAAALGFMVEAGTLAYMRSCAEELQKEPSERTMGELRRALEVSRPSVFFRVLDAAGLLDVTFPEIAALRGKTQPTEFHPEGDAFEHTMSIVDAVAAATDDVTTRFTGLVHDIGKGETPAEMLPHHYGHEKAGLDVLAAWNRRMTLPHTWMKAASFVIREHMRAPRLTHVGKIADLLLGIGRSGLSMEQFTAVIRADHGTLPDYLMRGAEYLAAMLCVTGRDAPAHLVGAQIGAWLREERIRTLRKILAERRADPFYSAENMAVLSRRIADIKAGRNVSEHDPVEVKSGADVPQNEK